MSVDDRQAPADSTGLKPVRNIAIAGIVLFVVSGALGSINDVMQNVATAIFGIPATICIIVWILRARHNKRVRAGFNSAPQSAVSPSDRPAPQPYGVSHAGAESLAASWMRWMGLDGAQVTQLSNDGGIDVEQADWVAQVKNYSAGTNVGRPEVQNIYGVAMAEAKRAMFFTSSGYSAGAIEFADRVGAALFVYSAERGELTASNRTAADILRLR
ncbi:restriction endonuclease [Curtobacterium sp. MCBD17_019]|uniref:restriction endonuclease n=1 Tax=Curtobacterium sp. MCBD17_019 TaxID=2175669 RepID=UPI0015E8C59C|nr:restriction endonuclease [Curtobacterium sp. MCBD17_019]